MSLIIINMYSNAVSNTCEVWLVHTQLPIGPVHSIEPVVGLL